MKLFNDKSKEISELQPEKSLEEEKNTEPAVKLPEIKKLPPPPPPHRAAIPSPSHSPPVFIKVNRYKDIVKSIRDLKSYLLNLRDALDTIEDIHKEVTNGIEVAHKTLDELNLIISNFDSLFMRPQGIESHMEEEEAARPERMNSGEVEGHMKDVYSQLEKLRTQLKTID
ncbi:MAG: hypothetical protein V3U72_02610 [Candidatus Aenigmarchaeota archaeon]